MLDDDQFHIKKPVLICGAVQISIIARALSGTASIERKGDVVMDIGGAANNMAVSASGSGVPVRLLSALKSHSPYTSMIVDQLTGCKVMPFIQYESEIQEAACCVHLDENDNIISSVISNPIETVEINSDLYESAMDGVCGCVIDGSFSPDSIYAISHCAMAAGTPVFARVSSKEQSERLVELDVEFSAIFLGYDDLDWLAERGIDSLITSWAKQFNCPVVIMTSGKSAILADPSGSVTYCGSVELGVESQKDYFCAGDVLAINTVIHCLYGGRCIHESLRIALCAMEEDAISRHLDIAEDGGRMNCAIRSVSNAASIDALTGLPNRATAIKKLEQLTDRNLTFFVAMVDIDRFKQVNDTYGHNIGDNALILVAQSLSNSMRETDFCARWGGEEFLCIISRGLESISDARMVMERARQAVETLELVDGNLTVSVGMAAFCGDLDAALKAADIALYRSKHGGRNRVSIADSD